jgi:glutaredoxin-like protein NrdH
MVTIRFSLILLEIRIINQVKNQVDGDRPMITIEKVEGKDRGKVMLYALSTCVWCKRTKQLLNDLGVKYDYIFIDLLSKEDRKEVEKQVETWNPRCSYPTLVINDKQCIVGFKEEEIKGALGV